jgi:hypothetical protein
MEEISDYAARNHLSEQELNLLCTSTAKKALPKAWVQIAQVLPERSVLSIHNLVHRRFNPENYAGAWSKEEE